MSLVVHIIGDNKLSRTLGNIGGKVFKLGTKFAKFGAIAGAAIAGISIKLAGDMEKGLREIGTLMGGLTDNQMKSMGKELEHLAATSGQAMDKLTKARYDIVSAGFAEAAASAKLLQVSADLAVGGVSDVSTAADLLTTSLNAYNLTAENASEISDKLFTIVRLGKTTITELGSSMGRVLAISGQLGISMDEVGAVLATLTAGGINTAEATTSMNAAITQLINPTEELKVVIKDLGFESGFAMVKSKGFAESIRLIKEKADETDTPMTDLFANVRAVKAILPLTGTAAGKFAENLKQMGDSAGATTSAVTEMRKSFNVQLSMLKQNVNNILRVIGRSLISIIQPKIEAANDILSTLGDIGWDVVAGRIANNFDRIRQIIADVLTLIKNEIAIKANEIFMELPWFLGGPSDKEAMANIAAAQADIDLMTRVIAFQVENMWNEISDNTNIKAKEFTAVTSKSFVKIQNQSKITAKKVKRDFSELREEMKHSGDVAKLTAEQKIFAMKAVSDSIFALASINKDASKTNFKIWKRAAQIQAIVDTYAGANAAFKAMAGIPVVGPALGIAAAAAAIAAGLARVSQIEQQTFAFGGQAKAINHTDTVPAMLAPREIVSTPAAADQFGDEITRMNQLAEGGFSGESSGRTIIIQALDSESFEEWGRRNPRGFGNTMKFVSERGFDT